ncbi:MAG: glutamine synthetase III, partial [Clostridia bacterium]|nr:glutamine synthetase III [Clostridia bacterium]
GLRATFEARGYTTWDPTSYAFIKGKTLCIPTAFCSYNGEALDKKTPLLRSMDAIDKAGLRLLKALGRTDVKRITPMAGAEQEYFLIPEEMYNERMDLKFTGRTLFGAMPPKGQEMDDHYFGTIKSDVLSYMEEINEELWKLGVLAKTEHNEVAPSQHELASIYRSVNVTTDQNQIVMETMKRVAKKHGLVCLLHEKPFLGVNGSGKHNNWSLATDKGENLIAPGKEPYKNIQFLAFIAGIVKAVDDYQDLLRISVATASNDHRLGANEAPPAIVSMFLGDELLSVLDAIENDREYVKDERKYVKLGVDELPVIFKDNTDRNRTTPFAYTGNKFEFRMPGSSDSIATANVMINSAVAEGLEYIASCIEGKEDVKGAVYEIVKEIMKEHKHIIFNGNGYDEAWVVEASKRGLLNYRTTPECVPHLVDSKNVEMLVKHGVYTEKELYSHCDIIIENYCKTAKIEAKTMVFMADRQIVPAVEEYAADIAGNISVKREAVPGLKLKHETETVKKLSDAADLITDLSAELAEVLASVKENTRENALKIKDVMLPLMEKLRAECDKAESLTAKEYWPFPGYEDILFGVK